MWLISKNGFVEVNKYKPEHDPTGTSSTLEQTDTHPLVIFLPSIPDTGEIIANSSQPMTNSLFSSDNVKYEFATTSPVVVF